MTCNEIRSATLDSSQGIILFNPCFMAKPRPEFFSSEYWNSCKALLGHTTGRGPTYFIRWRQSAELVLRAYTRGGAVRAVLEDRFLWTGLARSRAWREWHLLAGLQRSGLPVPFPIAALIRRKGLYYTASIITKRIQNAQPLSTLMFTTQLELQTWVRIGAAVRQLHQAGVYHADLNAHNILLDQQSRVWIIDFDKGKTYPAMPFWRRANLRRLKRSLEKLTSIHSQRPFDREKWLSLLSGYTRPKAGKVANTLPLDKQ